MDLCVAHFRRVWFLPTETFLHNTLRACRATRPVLVGYDGGRGPRSYGRCQVEISPIPIVNEPPIWRSSWPPAEALRSVRVRVPCTLMVWCIGSL